MGKIKEHFHDEIEAGQKAAGAAGDDFTTMECTLTDAELVAKVDKLNGDMCRNGGRAWHMRVPPDPNNDSELLISNLCKRFEKLAGL